VNNTMLRLLQQRSTTILLPLHKCVCVCVLWVQVQFFNYLLDMNNCIMHEFPALPYSWTEWTSTKKLQKQLFGYHQRTISTDCIEGMRISHKLALFCSFSLISSSPIDNNMCVICTKLFIYMCTCLHALMHCRFSMSLGEVRRHENGQWVFCKWMKVEIDILWKFNENFNFRTFL
jgi:hypothetical protein